MSLLADFLDADSAVILERFAKRLDGSIAPEGLTTSQLVDHLPEFLTQVAQALRQGGRPSERLLRNSDVAHLHGAQRSSLGYDLNALVREYGVLRDTLYERMEEVELTPSLRELRILSDCLSGAIGDSVESYVDERQADSDEERKHLLGLFEQAPGFVCFLRGRELVFELANSAYYQMVGHREILGKTVRAALPEVEGQGFFELLDNVFSSGEAFVGRALKAELQRLPGAPLSEAYMDLIYQPIRAQDGSVLGILVQGNDVTEAKHQELRRRAAEEALRTSDARYRTLFESIDDGFCLIELILDGRGVAVDYLFLETNTAFEAQTGLQHAVGKTILELVPDVSRAWFQRYGRVAQTGESDRFEHHDPALSRWFDVYANRVGSPDLRQVAVVFKDISERKRIEVERERLLESESEARRQAEEASHLKDEFLATVSHELRTPLNAMLGWVHLLRSGTLAPDKRERALETVERNARAQAKLIEDLLDVSRILAGKLGLQIEPLAMHALVEAALETVRPAAEAKNIVLQPVLAMGGVVMGDAHRLQQVVWNLLSNAVKFTPRGGQIRVHVAARDSSVELIVADTGQGIASEFLPHVFERFRQQDGGTARVHGGLGLGLSIVRQLVELHGGTVSVYSAGIGRGASFTVRLPLALARGQEASSSAALQQALLTNALRCPAELAELDVLVVDDEHDAREMLRAMLETCGARVRVATSVSEAVRAFEAAPPALLVSDIGMPEADGYVLIEKVRKLGPDAGGRVPAIALTAYARSEDRTRALLSGFDSHVAKPIEPLELLAVIASLTGVHHERS